MDYSHGIPCYFRVKFGNDIKFIDLSWSDLSFAAFKEKFVSEFNVNLSNGSDANLKLTDNLGAEIPRDKFEHILKTFYSGSLFTINVSYDWKVMQQSFRMVTPLMIENYFWQKNLGDLLSLKKEKILNDKQRRKIIGLIVDFMIESYGLDITLLERCVTAFATVTLFPALKYKDSKDGTDLLLGDNGYFTRRINYIKSFRARRQREMNASMVCDDSIGGNEPSLEDQEDDLQFLKYCLVRDLDENVLIQKLNSTRALRQEKMKDTRFDLRENFPFFFSAPHLLLLDYREKFKQASSDVEFLTEWPTFKVKLVAYYQSKYGDADQTEWSNDIEEVLYLLKLFPTKLKRNRVQPFRNLINKLVVYRVIGTAPEAMIEKSNDHPYIVAYGKSTNEIELFYIEIEKHLIPLPKEFDFVQTFDLFFKIHKVFNLNFEPALANMMNFIQNFLYNISDGQKKPTMAMKEIHNQLI